MQNNPLRWNDPTGHSSNDPNDKDQKKDDKCTETSGECIKITTNEKTSFFRSIFNGIRNWFKAGAPGGPIGAVEEIIRDDINNPSLGVKAPTIKIAPKLPEGVARNSFAKNADGSRKILGYYLDADLDLYKVFGDPQYMTYENPEGLWLTPIRWESSSEAIEKMALAWGQTAEHIVRVHVPAGTAVYVGPAGEQNTERGHFGSGATQYYIRPQDFSRVKFSPRYERVERRPPGK